MIRIFIACH